MIAYKLKLSDSCSLLACLEECPGAQYQSPGKLVLGGKVLATEEMARIS